MPGTPSNPQYSIGNVTEADLNDPSVLTPENYNFVINRLKESVGIAVQWLAPLGLFRFSPGLGEAILDSLVQAGLGITVMPDGFMALGVRRPHLA